MSAVVRVYTGERLADYSFGADHPFGPLRHQAFVEEFERRGLSQQVQHGTPVMADQIQIARFHGHEYIEMVKLASARGTGFLDGGDTPAFRGVYEAAATVVGTALDALKAIMTGRCERAFVPIAGLHHARRNEAAGFCVFNDCGVVIETLRHQYGIKRIAYVDIDAHHGDGVFYSFEADPDLCVVDLHEDGRYLYPGTGRAEEKGIGQAEGSKMNIPLPPETDDRAFRHAWLRAEEFVDQFAPEFIILQCGADSLRGDPLTHLAYTEQSHAYATRQLAKLADKHCKKRLLALGGGGYDPDNLSRAWCAVVENLLV